MTTRVVVHVDDVGMCHGTTTAFVDLRAAGVVSSGSVMVPCPWSSEALECAAADSLLDVGVHLTLNSEHRHYRWGPVSRPSRLSGLVDHSGAMWRSVVDLRGSADPEAVLDEWRAQIDRALSAGVDVTHLDTHMGSAFAPEWADRYIELGVEYDLPVLVTRTIAGYGVARHLPDVTEAEHEQMVRAAADAGMPIVDVVIESDFSRPVGTQPDLIAMLDSVLMSDPELVYLALHPCHGGEIEFIDPARSHVRTDEVDALTDPAWAEHVVALSTSGRIEVIGMSTLRDEFRAARR